MSKLSTRSSGRAPLYQVAEAVQTAMRERGAELVRQDMAEAVLNMESLNTNPALNKAVDRFYDDSVAMLKSAYEAAGIKTEAHVDSAGRKHAGYTEAQWRAGVVALAAAGDAGRYVQEAYSVRQPSSGKNIDVIDFSSMNIDSTNFRQEARMNLEAFDDRELKANLPFSVVFNIQAARQNSFGEAFYPTVVVTPDQSGLDIAVRRTMVFNEVRHDPTGKAMDFHRVNLINAVIDPTILLNDSIQATPIYLSGSAANNACFTSAVTPTPITIQGLSYDTAPLAFGVELDLLGLSSTSALIQNGALDNTDSLDQRIVLNNLYLQMTAADATVSVFQFNTLYLPRAQWQKSPEGFDRELMLNFVTVDLPLTKATLDVTGLPAVGLTGSPAAPSQTVSNALYGLFHQTAYANLIVRLGVNVTGQANIELGNVQVAATPVTIQSVWQPGANGTLTQVTDGTILTAVATAFGTMTMVGYDLQAARSNINRRVRGLLVTSVEQNERYTIPLGPPVTSPNPVTSTKSSTDMAAPITAARIRNDNLAVTKLLAYRDQLAAYNQSNKYTVATPQIEGIGRLLVHPFFYTENVDCLELVNSIKSQDRALDVSAALINKIRERVYQAYTESGYQPALDAATGGTGETPTVLIGTDPTTQRHLIIPGDTRLMSIGFDHEVVTSYDIRMRDRIYVTFVRKGLSGPDPLSFGAMAWMPELATNIQVTRNNATTTETMVQPRVLHINTCPILIEFLLSNLGEAVGDRLAVPFQTVTYVDPNENIN